MENLVSEKYSKNAESTWKIRRERIEENYGNSVVIINNIITNDNKDNIRINKDISNLNNWLGIKASIKTLWI